VKNSTRHLGLGRASSVCLLVPHNPDELAQNHSTAGWNPCGPGGGAHDGWFVSEHLVSAVGEQVLLARVEPTPNHGVRGVGGV